MHLIKIDVIATVDNSPNGSGETKMIMQEQPLPNQKKDPTFPIKIKISDSTPPPKYVYRIDFRAPTEIFPSGFRCLGTNPCIFHHLTAGCETSGISTTSSLRSLKAIIMTWFDGSDDKDCWVYKIRATENFHSVPETLNYLLGEKYITAKNLKAISWLKKRFSHQNEWISFSAIDRSTISKAWRINKSICNKFSMDMTAMLSHASEQIENSFYINQSSRASQYVITNNRYTPLNEAAKIVRWSRPVYNLKNSDAQICLGAFSPYISKGPLQGIGSVMRANGRRFQFKGWGGSSSDWWQGQVCIWDNNYGERYGWVMKCGFAIKHAYNDKLRIRAINGKKNQFQIISGKSCLVSTKYHTGYSYHVSWSRDGADEIFENSIWHWVNGIHIADCYGRILTFTNSGKLYWGLPYGILELSHINHDDWAEWKLDPV